MILFRGTTERGGPMRTATLLPWGRWLFTLLLCWSAVGCGGRNPDGRFAVSGSVTYDGQPVTNGTIGFGSDSLLPAGAEIVDGRYEIPRGQGPQQGTYSVMIYADRPSGRMVPGDEGSTEMVSEMEQYIPMIYNSRSALQVEISGDREDLDFDLEKPSKSMRTRPR